MFTNWRAWFKPEKLVPFFTIAVAFVAQILALLQFIQLTVGEQLILLLLALLAIDALTERLKLFEKLKEEINNLWTGQNTTGNFFSLRYEIPPLRDFIADARSIDICGASLLAVITQNRELISKKVEEGCKIRLLFYNYQNDELINMAYEPSGSPNPENLLREIKMSLDILRSIQSFGKGAIEVRLLDQPIAHTILVTDASTLKGKMRVELYVTGKDGPHRPGFFLVRNKASLWYDTFFDEFEIMWHKAVAFQ